jgi:nucleoside 2-deoxyribosyltransferase
VNLYLAGPLFTQAERRWLRELASRLEIAGHGVFLPQDHAELPLLSDPPDYHGAFEACRDAVDRCDALVAVLDGADADSGTAWECGYAYARGKPIIALRTDFRGGEDQGLNLMLRRSASEILERSATDENLDALAAELARRIAKLEIRA